MFPLNQGSSLSQDSSLNKTPRDNCYISSYKGPNGILEDVPKMAQTIILLIRISDLEDEPMKRGIPYNFTVLNSPVTGQLGKRIINPKW